MAEEGMMTQWLWGESIAPFFTLAAQAQLATILSTYVLSAQGPSGEKKEKNSFLALMYIV